MPYILTLFVEAIVHNLGNILFVGTVLPFSLLAIFSMTVCLVRYLAISLVSVGFRGLGGVGFESFGGVLTCGRASLFPFLLFLISSFFFSPSSLRGF